MKIGLGLLMSRRRGGGGGFNPAALFANVGATPAFVYSTVKLVEAYSGPSIRVLRPSDSAEADIGFDGYRLDETALYAHIGAQTGQITRWYDQSGAGNHSAVQATAARRLQIGPDYRHNGNLVPYGNQIFYDLPAITLDRRAFSLFISGRQRNGGLQGFWRFGAGGSNFLATNATTDFGSIRLPQSRSVIEYVAGPTQVRRSVNEVTTVNGALAAGTETGGALGLNTAGYLFIGDADAFIGYQSTLSDPDRAALKAALSYSYDIEVNAARRIVFIGDSITQGANDPRLIGFALRSGELLNGSAHLYLSAGGGNQITTLASGGYATSWGRAVLTAFPSEERIVFIHMGTNDLTLGGRSAAQIYADIQTVTAAAKADGAKVIVSTILATGSWNGTQQATRNTLNQSIRDNWATFADGFCDFAADPVMGTQAAASDPVLFPDSLHPSSLGHQNLAVIAADAINGLLAPVAPSITGVPTISGTTTQGQTLTASPATASGAPTPTRVWQWRRDGVDIGGATSSSYTLVLDDVGAVISVRQTETNGSGSAIATSADTAVIAPSAGFTPADLFLASEAGFWAPVTTSRLWQDVARTTPVTAAGQPVGSWQLTTASGVIYAEQATAGSRPTYQVDTGVGYLDFDGTDDSLVVTSLNLTATDEMTVIASVQKDTDASLGIIVEHSVGAFGADGSFNILAGGTGAPAAEYGALVRGTSFSFADTPATFPAPIKNYVTGLFGITPNLLSISASGSTPVTVTSGIGSGNFTTQNFFIGSRNQASMFLNGRIYGLIVRGALTAGADLTNAEAWADDLINP